MSKTIPINSQPILLAVVFGFLFLLLPVYARQATTVPFEISNSNHTSRDLTVTAWNSSSCSNLNYNETFTNRFINGTAFVTTGEINTLSVDFNNYTYYQFFADGILLNFTNATEIKSGDTTCLKVRAGQGQVAAEDVDTTTIQRRVSSTCSAGNSIRVINEDGTVTCETDDSGQVQNGTLLYFGNITNRLYTMLDFTGTTGLSDGTDDTGNGEISNNSLFSTFITQTPSNLSLIYNHTSILLALYGVQWYNHSSTLINQYGSNWYNHTAVSGGGGSALFGVVNNFLTNATTSGINLSNNDASIKLYARDHDTFGEGNGESIELWALTGESKPYIGWYVLDNETSTVPRAVGWIGCHLNLSNGNTHRHCSWETLDNSTGSPSINSHFEIGYGSNITRPVVKFPGADVQFISLQKLYFGDNKQGWIFQDVTGKLVINSSAASTGAVQIPSSLDLNGTDIYSIDDIFSLSGGSIDLKADTATRMYGSRQTTIGLSVDNSTLGELTLTALGSSWTKFLDNVNTSGYYAGNGSGLTQLNCANIIGSPDSDFCTDVDSGGGNATFNQSLTDTLYGNIIYGYNHSSVLINQYGSNWYNHTAASASYNHSSVLINQYGLFWYNTSTVDQAYADANDANTVYYGSSNITINSSNAISYSGSIGTDPDTTFEYNHTSVANSTIFNTYDSRWSLDTTGGEISNSSLNTLFIRAENDTEAEWEAFLTDVTDLFTNNDFAKAFVYNYTAPTNKTIYETYGSQWYNHSSVLIALYGNNWYNHSSVLISQYGTGWYNYTTIDRNPDTLIGDVSNDDKVDDVILTSNVVLLNTKQTFTADKVFTTGLNLTIGGGNYTGNATCAIIAGTTSTLYVC